MRFVANKVGLAAVDSREMSRSLKVLDPTSADPSREGDEEVMALIASHQSSLQAFLRSLVPAGGEVEDILQRVNLVIWRKRENFELGSNFKAWAFAIARWESLAYLKERKRGAWLLFDSELAHLVEEELSQRTESHWQEQQEELADCLQELSPKNRALIYDRYGLGMSLIECAKKWERSEGGLRVTFHRLRAALRQCIDRKQRRQKV